MRKRCREQRAPDPRDRRRPRRPRAPSARRPRVAANPDYEPEPFEEFCDEHLRADDFDPAASLAVIDGERIVGYLLGARRRRGVGHVSVLGVDPTVRRRGVASLLLYRAFAIWRADGIGRAELNVASDNPGAERLYRRLGMEVVFTQDCYERPLESQRKGAYLEHGASSALD